MCIVFLTCSLVYLTSRLEIYLLTLYYLQIYIHILIIFISSLKFLIVLVVKDILFLYDVFAQIVLINNFWKFKTFIQSIKELANYII